jgi:DUF971 family protein
MKPARIKQMHPVEIEITWDDGHRSPFGTDYLRRRCPCATCQTEREQDSLNGRFPLLLANQSQLSNVELSGHNAMVLTWGDGHKTGIYTWGYLREICPCPICKQ